MSKVSIGLPVYNGEKYLSDCLESLLGQSFFDFELIISDNASTDQTELICIKYAQQDKRIRYIRHSENKGAQFNFGFVLDSANTDYFMWAAADDVFLSNWIEVLFNYLELNREAVGVIGKISITDENLKVRKEYQPCQVSPKTCFRVAFREFTGEGAGQVYALYRRWAIIDPLRKQKLNAWSTDIPFLMRVAANGIIASTSNTGYFARDHNSSLGKSLWESRKSFVRLLLPVPFDFYCELYDAFPGRTYSKLVIIIAHFVIYVIRHYVRSIFKLVMKPSSTLELIRGIFGVKITSVKLL